MDGNPAGAVYPVMKDENLDVTGQLGPLRRYALSLTRHSADAEDLVHDTLVKAIERQAQFRRGHNLRTWLLSILHNAFVDQKRARRAETLRTAEFGRSAETAAPAGQEHSARLADVRDAFLSLPDDQRAALHLVSIDGLSYEDAAAALGVPVGTVVSRISRARAQLRA
ncbi:MAG: sigma-70 family RNA polymerase sigma factor, partial [Sphingomonadales bacterium]